MSKRNIKISNNEELFANIKSYSIDEVLAAGGTTAFAEKLGKSWENLVAKLETMPKDAFLTDEEFEEAMKTLNQSK